MNKTHFSYPRFFVILFLVIVAMVSAVSTTFATDPVPEATITFLETSPVAESVNVTAATTVITEPTEVTVSEAETEASKPAFFSPDITYNWQYIHSKAYMPYMLFTPEGANNAPTALLVWLHGSGEKNVSETAFLRGGLPKLLDAWETEGFNAYVICPHLRGMWNTGLWSDETARKNLQQLLDNFIVTHGIDRNNVVIAGHSLGAQGTLYMISVMPGYFSRAALLSGYGPFTDFSHVSIPVIGYVGTKGAGEDYSSVCFMITDFAEKFGEENCIIRDCSHGAVPSVAFNEDLDGNNRSDLIEWLFADIEGVA